MSTQSATLPPHIALLLSEPFDLQDPASVRKKLKGMAGDLRDQAETASPALLNYDDKHTDAFHVILSGGLDLFAGSGACQAMACRVRYVDQVSRSIALIADQVSLHDYLEGSFCELSRRPTNAQVDTLVPDIYVLKRLAPLLEAGLVQFVSPYVPYCKSCIGGFEAEVEATTDALLLQLGDQISVQRSDGEVVIDTGPMYSPPLVLGAAADSSEGRSDQELLREIALTSVRTALWHARDAAHINGVVFSNSRLGVNGLLHQEGQRFQDGELQAYAAQRAAELPWVNGLTVAQTLQLREEAGKALPALRAFLARRIANRSTESAASQDLDYVSELREQAIEVRNELEIVSTKSRILQRNATGILGLGIAALSVAVETPSFATVGSLLTTLGLIHQMPAPDTQHEQRLRRKPGYVLVAAQNILAHEEREQRSVRSLSTRRR